MTKILDPVKATIHAVKGTAEVVGGGIASVAPPAGVLFSAYGALVNLNDPVALKGAVILGGISAVLTVVAYHPYGFDCMGKLSDGIEDLKMSGACLNLNDWHYWRNSGWGLNGEPQISPYHSHEEMKYWGSRR